jgi:hypothetical protein
VADGGRLGKLGQHDLKTLLGLSHVGVVGAEVGLEDGPGALKGGAGGRPVPKAPQHVPEVGEVGGEVGVVGPEPRLQDPWACS